LSQVEEVRNGDASVIARIWRGAVRASDADVYGQYIRDTGLAGYAATPGSRGAWLLRRTNGDRTEFVTFTLWESLEAVKGFAGDDYETPVYYPEDDRFLIERDEICAHYEVEGDSARDGS
jgi:heme-degrading monooxygenase HmoA